MLFRLLRILFETVKGLKRDYFLSFKFYDVQNFYGDKCLDVGAGNGSYAIFLSSLGKDVTAVDVVDASKSYPVVLFDGTTLPFTDKSFDTTLLMFVLHHTDHQEKLIKECRRVTKGNIIIAEDLVENTFDRILGNIHLGTSPWSKSENGFKTDASWRLFFKGIGLSVTKSIIIPRATYPVYPVKRGIYVLSVGDALE